MTLLMLYYARAILELSNLLWWAGCRRDARNLLAHARRIGDKASARHDKLCERWGIDRRA